MYTRHYNYNIITNNIITTIHVLSVSCTQGVSGARGVRGDPGGLGPPVSSFNQSCFLWFWFVWLHRFSSNENSILKHTSTIVLAYSSKHQWIKLVREELPLDVI